MYWGKKNTIDESFPVKRDGGQSLVTGNLMEWQQLLEKGSAKVRGLSSLF